MSDNRVKYGSPEFANKVKELRKITGAGMMDCSRAMRECEGDFEKSIEYLKTHNPLISRLVYHKPIKDDK